MPNYLISVTLVLIHTHSSGAMFRYCFLLLCALLLVQPASADPTAAVCVVKHQQQLLLVQDRVSSRYSLAGGCIDAGETPQQAAQRELFEETGLRSRISGELGQWQGAVLFACQALQPIRVQAGSGFVSLLQAPNLGGEILNARLIDPSQLPHAQRRFPAQLDWLAPRLADIPDSPVLWQHDFSTDGNELHRAELPLIRQLQSWLGTDVLWLDASNLFGSAAFQLALLPLLLPLLGWPRLRQLLLAMLTLALMVLVVKEGIGWPRPFHLDPALAQQSAQGFGMPSGHAASALLFWGVLLRLCWPANPWRSVGTLAGCHDRVGPGLARRSFLLGRGGRTAAGRADAGNSRRIIRYFSKATELELSDLCLRTGRLVEPILCPGWSCHVQPGSDARHAATLGARTDTILANADGYPARWPGRDREITVSEMM
nr:NUDIX domain-containing protein [Aeromonas salmonicida]